MSPDLAREPSWRAALEEALETLAAQLEGCGDQELVIRGEGEDGDISLDILQPELGPLPRTSVPDRTAAQILLAVDIEGPDHATPAAAFALFQIFSAAVEVSGLTLTWRPRPAIPTALAMVSMITTPYRARHPDVSFTILSRNSIEVLGLLENLEVDAGLTYLDNEPLGRVQTVPLYSEQYRLLTSSDSPLGSRDQVTWAEVGKVPLCLLTPDMQNRRIIEQLLRQAGAEVAPTLESNSIVVLFAHVRTGKWASVMPAKLAEVLGLTEKVRAIPIVEPEVTHSIGLVVPHRNPLTPLIHALVREAKELAPILGASASAPERTRRPTRRASAR